MLDVLVTSAGLLLHDTELLWLRSDGGDGFVVQLLGGGVKSAQPDPEARVWLARSLCSQWNPDLPGCDESTMLLSLSSEPAYDVVAWSEAPDRRVPIRERIDVALGWRFEPGDIDLDGRLTCADLDRFVAAKYDWNHDGAADAADLSDLAGQVVRGRADLDDDGDLDLVDLFLLEVNWGSCPPAPEACPADLNCDGDVGFSDILLFLSALGG